MPRAFLITHRRYDATMDTPNEDSSPDRQPDSDCLEELYNLTKLAEVSLAAAAGRLTRYRHLNATNTDDADVPKHCPELDSTPYGYSHKLFDKTSRRVGRNEFKNVEESSCSSDSKPDDTRPEGSLGGVDDDDYTSGDSTCETSRRAVVVTAATATQDDCHECPDCGKKYSTSSNLARHRQTHRSLADKKARRCPHCDKVYVSMPAFSMHVRTHNQGCRCHFCGKCFSRPWLLQGHIRTHTGEKPFKCSVCSKAFADKSNLRAHVQTHSNTKPHTCARCGKAFALKSYLYKHEESSCMRLHQSNAAKRTSEQVQTTAQHQQTTSPSVIVTLPRPREYFGHRSAFETTSTVIRSPERPSGSPGRPHDPDGKQKYVDGTTNVYERDTVISPNPERLIYCSVQHPSVILSNGPKYGSVCQERPVDFSRENPVQF